MANLPADLDFSLDRSASPDRMNRATASIDARLRALEVPAKTLDQQLSQLQQIGLQRITDALLPVYNELTTIGSLGIIFSANSVSPVAIATGSATFMVSDLDHDRFAPAAYLLAVSAADPVDAMLGRTVAYDRASGTVTLDVLIVSGSGIHADWTLWPAPPPKVLASVVEGGSDVVVPSRTAIRLPRSKVAGRRPGDGRFPALTDGEVFINQADAVIAWLDATGTLQSLPLSVAAILASAALTGTPTTPNVTAGDASTRVANTAFVANAITAVTAAIEGAAPGALDTLQELAAALGNDANYAATTAAALANRLRVDSAQPLTAIQKAQARATISAAPFEALAYQNLAINPRHRISQINGDAAVAISNATAYLTDNWVVTAAGVAVSAQRVASPFPTRPDLSYGLKLSVSTAKTTLSATDALLISHLVEGIRSDRLLWGTSAAVPLAVGLMVRANYAGTVTLALHNGGLTRTFIHDVPVAANTDTFVSLVVPGDIAGAWAAGINCGLRFDVGFAAGSGTAAATDTWENSAVAGSANTTNMAASASNTVVVSDLILLPVPAAAIPVSLVFPQDRLPFFRREDEDEYRFCQRFYEVGSFNSRQFVNSTAQVVAMPVWFKTNKRTNPNIAYTAINYSNSSNAVADSASPIGFRHTHSSTGGSPFGEVNVSWVADARF